MTALRFSPWVVSEHVPDLSSFERMLEHPRFADKQGQDLAIALWDLMVDPELGLFHYIPALSPYWGKDEYDGIKTWNIYGYTICHCHANILAAMGRAAGFKTRIANIKGHEGTEIWYDDAWHYFDGDIQMFYRKHAPDQNQIASLAEIHADTTLITDQKNPSYPFHFPDRLPENIVSLYEVDPGYLPTQDETIHSMDFVLRPGEKMQRYFGHKGRRFVSANAPDSYQRYGSIKNGIGPAETGPEGPTERFWPHRQWGNGFYWYAPNLTNASQDFAEGVLCVDGVSPTDKGLQSDGGTCIFDFSSPYLYCGVADPMKRLPSKLGALLHLEIDGSIQVEVSDEQGNWLSIVDGSDSIIDIDYTEHVEGRLSFHMRIHLNGVLKKIENTLWFMVSPHSLPALRNAGNNKLQVRHGDKFGFPSRSFLIERNFFEADTIDDCHATSNALFDGNDYARVKPVDEQKAWQLIYAVRAPESESISWLTIYTEFEGTKPGEETDTPARIEIAVDPEGPWQIIGEMDVVEHPQGWHFTVFAETQLPANTAVAYIRFSCKKGFKGFRINAHHHKQAMIKPTQPLLITHAWYEEHQDVGRRLQTHEQKIDNLEEAYDVHCTHEPHNHFVAMSIPST